MKMPLFAVIICAFLAATGFTGNSPVVTKVKIHTAQNEDLDFNLINATGYDIGEVFMSPNTSNDWGSDIMGGAGLKNTVKAKVTFNPTATAALWDLKVTWVGYESSEDAIWKALDLTKINNLTLKYDANTNKTTAYWD